jgi:serine/threonine-protein kinase
MTPERWRQVEETVHAVLSCAESERGAYLARACGGDEALRREVESLLARQASTEGFLEDPALAAAGLMVSETGGSMLTGRRFGAYEVHARIGAGGMGEVYHARDTKLGRDVAIKILPRLFVNNPDRLARFAREARVLASLNHPHIGAIYGLEDADGVRALVLELVHGETLADRIARGPIPLNETLNIARQIAVALEAAHEKGIVHRDLKPANIKLTPDGVVKVLDFGLAKAASGDAPGDGTQPPTMTIGGTAEGVILGTATYMSPEQARGRPADKRADVWAFGVVLYEMLTGRRPFDGEDMTEVLGAVVRLEPNWEALPPDVPQIVRTLLQRCLVKDRRARIADIAAALFVLDHQAGATAMQTASAAPLPRRPSWPLIAALTTGALVVAALGGAMGWFATRPAPSSVVRTTITTSGSTALTLSASDDRNVAITPDGSRIVYRGNNQLLVRALDQLEPSVLSGLGRPQGVFISPDGQWVGFFDRFSLLKKVAIAGGSPVELCAVQGVPRGATWGEDGTVIFATNASATGLQRVSATGGEPTMLTKPDRERGEGDHVWPEFLPGGEAVLFTITAATTGIENAQIALLDLRTGRTKVLIRGGSHAQYVPSGLGSPKRTERQGGHLVYGVKGTLRAVKFDLGRREVVGTPAPVLEGVVTTNQGAADVAVAANGSLVYVPGRAGGGDRTVVSVDQQGRASPLPGLPLDAYRDVRVSPDGARLALATETDVWTYDVLRTTLSRLTTDPAQDRSPLWTPDGQRIIFTSTRAGYPELFWRPADGTGSDERLLARAKDLLDLRATGWSADGRHLLFTEVPPSIQCAIGQITIERPSDVKLLVKSEFCNSSAAVSPDGRWMAYDSNLSGSGDVVYVERYPELGSRQPISTGNGRLPIWSRSGRELFFSSLDGRQMFEVPVRSGTTLVAGRPQVLFEFAMAITLTGRQYDIAPDERFLIIRSGQMDAGGGTASNLIAVQNWFEELKRLVPTN